MHAKASVAILASALLTQGVLALNPHLHAHRRLHEKKDVVYFATEVETVTSWTTVTVYDGEEPTVSIFAAGAHIETSSTSSSSSSTISTTSTTSTPTPSTTSTYVAPPQPTTTLLTTTSVATVRATSTVAPASSEDAANVVADVVSSVAAAVVDAVSTTAAAAETTTAASSSSSGSNKRGVAYNDASLTTLLLGSGTKISWGYNWGQTKDGLSDDVEFVPMLWGPTHSDTWSANAKAAISAGSKYLLSFNEPDNSGQSNLSPADAAKYHIEYMNDFSGSASIGAPAITNSNVDGEGISWLEQFVDACAGSCKFDFCPVHWYSPADPQDFLSHLLAATEACEGKPVWVTEYAPLTDDADTINSFSIDIQDQLDNNSTFSFVERYSYFMVSDGRLLSGDSLSVYGKTFAYA
ncbi:Alkali-sensitive linkage protein 1 [Pleurostoma richardsiae]|uniref:Alkali-sensitive linkage protein 1 n=1 Tax=Pleurostoma richardsiae TaxID=41990 RepID=A0AA38RHP6_9PEZI|nr:Alkali-sensitive linkage protein 1 [Pleurostoma richardsiae]